MFGKFLALWCLVDATLSTHVPSFMYEQAPPEPEPALPPRLATVSHPGHQSNPLQLVLSKDKQEQEEDEDNHKRLAVVTETLTIDNRDVKSLEQKPSKVTTPQSKVLNEKNSATTSLVDVRDFTERDETAKSIVSPSSSSSSSSSSSFDNTKFRATAANTETKKNTDTTTTATNLANTLDTTNTKESSGTAVSTTATVAQADVKNAANTKAHLAATTTLANTEDKKTSSSITTTNDASESKITDTKSSVAVPSVAVANAGTTITNTNEGAQKAPTTQLLATPPPAITVASASTNASPHSAVITITITTTNGGEISALPSVAPASSISSSDSFKQKATESSPPLSSTPPMSSTAASLPSGSSSSSGGSSDSGGAAVSDNSNVVNTPEEQLQSDQASEQLQAQQEEDEDSFAQARALETSNQARALAENAERAGTASEFGPGDPTHFSNWKPGTVADKRMAYLAGQGLLSPYPGLPVSRPRRAPRYPAPPFRSVEDYRLYREAQKQGLIAPADPLRMPIPGQPLYPSEPFGAWGNADFVGDNMVVQPFGGSGNPAQMGKLSSLKTTPGISCDSWRSCSECNRFSFCVWNDEGQSCRQEIDVIFSAVHQKYSKRCPMAGPRGDFAGPRRARETPAMFPDLSPAPPYMGTSSDMFEPPYYRRERIRAGLARDLQKGQMKGLWRTPQERVNWFSPDAPPSSRQTPELRFRQKPLIDATLEAKSEEQSSSKKHKKRAHLVHQDPPRFMSLTKVA